MNQPILLGKAYGQSYFAVIEEQTDKTFKGKIVDDVEKQFYDPMISFTHYNICLANLKNRFEELERKEIDGINESNRQMIDDLS